MYVRSDSCDGASSAVLGVLLMKNTVIIMLKENKAY